MLAQISQPAVYLGIAAFVVTWLALGMLWFRQARDNASIRSALRGSGGESLEGLLKDHLDSRNRLEGDFARAKLRLENTEEWMKHAYARVGLVRYDAFDDTGGRQSFALALQNEKGDGVILSSVAGREQTRTYGKYLVAGKCEQGLTPEEQEAVNMALGIDRGPGRT